MADNAAGWLNFDGRLTGEVARLVENVADARGLTPQALIAEVLAGGLSDRMAGRDVSANVKVEPMTINCGNAGIHVYTVVADLYGSLIAEDSAGQELARVDCTDDHADDLARLARGTLAATADD